jgi:hypothetical protein
MPSINLGLTEEQVKSLVSMCQNQVFRIKFVDPRIPGHKANPRQLEAAESAVQKLEAALKEDRFRVATAWEKPTRRAPLQRVK